MAANSIDQKESEGELLLLVWLFHYYLYFVAIVIGVTLPLMKEAEDFVGLIPTRVNVRTGLFWSVVGMDALHSVAAATLLLLRMVKANGQCYQKGKMVKQVKAFINL